ncbi:MAG TPA: hypothetical protein VNO32_31895 [Candidatus Acidoferrum sp.]|jgi:hypothetical protein|nr:hypothetical protein [Candidatus Acidoferrum sp.]
MGTELQFDCGLDDYAAQELMVELAEFRREVFRERLRAMSDQQLIKYGKAAKYMADPRNSADRRTSHDVYKAQLEECRAEWRRRHPK